MSAYQDQLNLSISVVLYNNSVVDLLPLLDSMTLAIKKLKLELPSVTVSLCFIDNSPLSDLDLGKNLSALTLETNPKVVQGHGNIGYGAAHNMAIETTESDFHLLLNPDVEIHEECLYQGIQHMIDNPNISISGPLGLDFKNKPVFLAKNYPDVFTLLLRGFFPHSIKEKFKARLDEYEMYGLAMDTPSTGIPVLSGCFMLCRTEILKGIGGFDPKFFLYFEDFDLSLRMQEQHTSCFNPAMRIKHGGGNASKKGFRHVYNFIRSMVRFYNKHGWKYI